MGVGFKGNSEVSLGSNFAVQAVYKLMAWILCTFSSSSPEIAINTTSYHPSQNSAQTRQSPDPCVQAGKEQEEWG